MERASRTRRTIRSIAIVVAFAVVASGFGVISAPPASAVQTPCNPDVSDCPDDPDVPIPYQPAGAGITYALDARASGWKSAWYSRDNAAKPWARESYDPSYVNPTSFPATFQRQCVDATDWNNEMNLGLPTVNTYRWTIDGVVKDLRTCYLTKLEFKGQGIRDVKLQVRNANGVVIKTKERTVLVKDKLVVLLGDSAASGEGSPEANRTVNQEYGTWVDRRCHRSSNAAVPKAVADMEAADPFTTITFLNFACSGATIERWVDEEGSGVLGPYVGIEQPTGVDPANVNTYLPSQVDQLDAALTRRFRNQPGGGDPIRSVDKLFISGGINDLKFSKLALVCVIYEDCVNRTSPAYGDGFSNVATVLQGYAAEIPGSFAKVDQALLSRDIVTDERYAMQYPDAFSKDMNNTVCSSMLEDVLPWSSVWFIVVVLAALVALLHVIALPLALIVDAALLALQTIVEAATGITDMWGILGDGLQGDLKWAPNEISWLKGTAMPALDNAVKNGAAAGHFTFVNGIAPLFKGHGYCATDNWIVRAKQASERQGPWNFLSKPLAFYTDVAGVHLGGLGVNAGTKGLMHPTPAGYNAIKNKLLTTPVQRDGRTEPMFEDFKDHAPVAVNDNLSLNTATLTQLDTGFGSGVQVNDLDVDGDELRSTLVTPPSHGTATLGNDGHLVYKPTAGFTGVDSLYYRVTDGGLNSGLARVNITVTNANAPFQWIFPVAPNRPTDARGQGIIFPVCSGCGGLTVKVATPFPAHGTVFMLPSQPVPGQWSLIYTATDSSSYTIIDGFDLVAGTTVNGVFTELHRARVEVSILPEIK